MFWSQLWRKGIRKGRVKSRRSCSGPQPASLQMCLTMQTARGTKWKSNPCLLKTHCSPTAPLIPQTRRLSMFSSFSSHDFPPVKLPFSCPAVHPPLGRLFSFFLIDGSGWKTAPFLWATCPRTAPTGGFSHTQHHHRPRTSSASTCQPKFLQLLLSRNRKKLTRGNNEFLKNFMRGGDGKKYKFLAV